MERQINMAENTEMVKELDLFDFMRYALRRYKLIAASALVGLLAAALYAFVLATPIYEATAQLYVVNSQDSVVNLSDIQIGSYLTEDYQLVMETWEVNQMVIENLSLPYSVSKLRDMVEVSNPGNSRIMKITVSSTNGAEAALIANEMAEVSRRYISDTMLTEMPSILSSALESTKPVSPRKTLIMIIGFVLGAALAVWGLLIAYSQDDKIKTSADILKHTGAMPLAVIPVISDKAAKRSRGR